MAATSSGSTTMRLVQSRQNGNNNANQQVGLAHPLKGRDWTEKASNAFGSPRPDAAANRTIITLKAGGRPGQSSARLPDGTVLVQASRQPFLEAARVLLNLGYPPELWLEGWRPGAAEFALRARLGISAGLTVDETRTVFAQWKAFPSSAVASPVRYSEGAATSLAEPSETIGGATVDDPDPPDKRRRPRTGNARALGSSDRAAAIPTYPNRLQSSSSRTRSKEPTSTRPAER
jgi:hypothetical protein